MIINLKAKVNNLDGKPLSDKGKDGDKELTLGDLLFEALNNYAEDKHHCGELCKKMYDAEKIVLGYEDYALIMEAVETRYLSVAVYLIMEELDKQKGE